VTNLLFSQLSQFVRYARGRFKLDRLAAGFGSSRPYPQIPSRPVWLSLLLGEVVHVPSHHQLEAETKLPQWQRWVGYPGSISEDTFNYVSERFDPAELRRAGGWINRQLKRGKAFEASKVHGMLVVSLDANEQFCSDHRCCEDCLSREVKSKDRHGRELKRTQYYHKQVYAQLSGPRLSVILDFEPMRPGEEECSAALRLLRRLRQQYGPRFLDLVVVDAWYANGPFLKAVVEELGWPIIAVLKQECRDVYQEAMALTEGKAPTQVVERDRRAVEIWEVKDLRFTDSYPGPVRVVRVRERWTERQRVGGKWVHKNKEQTWLWVVAGNLDGYDGATVRDWGHLRWKIENNAFGELTQHWHLTHCAHHHPVAVVVLLWIKLLAFTLFHAFALLHGKRVRLGRTTMQEERKALYRSLLCGEPILLFSG
jgi:hypothetical protein